MLLKLCLLLLYLIVLFLLARLVEALTWYENGSLSRRLLDPMTLSVAKLKALLEQRGVSYDAVVEKAELTQLVEQSGTIHEDEVKLLSSEEETEDVANSNTNFTSGAHFYEQVEDAKDSVWLVQILAKQYGFRHMQPPIVSDLMWKSIRKKVTKFGIHTGVLDCELDPWWCEGRGWHSSHLLLALPQVYKQKANVATHIYHGPLRETRISRWIKQMLHDKIQPVHDLKSFKQSWLSFNPGWEQSEIRALLFTDQDTIPMFFSALSVKFPGRVKFGVIHSDNVTAKQWTKKLLPDSNVSLPLYLIVTNEGSYIYGKNQGDCLTFSSMETVLKFLHPCLNDVFIFSFIMANLVSVLELFVAQGRFMRRLRRFLWCVVKYNAAVIMLWLPLITIFQLPYLENLPLFGLKLSRLLTTSSLGEAIRRDVFFFSQHPYILGASFVTACVAFGLFMYKITGGNYEEENEPYFNFAQMRTLTHLRSNEFFEPMSGYDLSGRLELFGSRLYLPTLALQPVASPNYVELLPTWSYRVESSSTYEACDRNHCKKTSDESKASNSSGKNDPQSKKGNCVNCDRNIPHSFQCSVSGQQLARSASANDLMDGNYYCECPRDPISNLGHHEHSVAHPRSYNSEETSASSFPSVHNLQRCSRCLENLPASSSSGVESQLPAYLSNPCLSSSSEVGSTNKVCDCRNWETGSCFPPGYLVSSQCVICLEEYHAGATLCGLPCSHVFHHSCVITWLKGDHHFCPVCRWPSFRPKPLVLQQQHAHDE